MPDDTRPWWERAADLQPRLVCQDHGCSLRKDGTCPVCGAEKAILSNAKRVDAPPPKKGGGE